MTRARADPYAPPIVKAPAPGRALLLSGPDFDAFLEPLAVPRGPRALHVVRPPGAVQRRTLRERIEVWARAVVPRLVHVGMEVEVVVPDEVEQHLSSGAPRAIAQRVVFVRDAFARSRVPREGSEHDSLRSHAYLAMTIDSVHVEVSLELCPEASADVKNLRARMADPAHLLQWTTMLQTLPDEFAIGVIGVPSFPRAQSADAEEVRALLDNSDRSRRPLWMGWSVKRELALAHAEDLEEQLADALVVLGQAYKLIAWAPDNDLIGATRRGVWRAGRVRADERRERGREERKTRRTSKHPPRREGSRREREDARRAFARADAEGAPATRAEPEGSEDPKGDAAARLVPKRPILPSTLRSRIVRVSPTGTHRKLTKGCRVRVLSGPFANKVGVVQELDGRGRARVQLGLLAATFAVADLTSTLEHGRPMLESSHRRLKKK